MSDSVRQDARVAAEEVKSGGLRGPALLERLLSIPRADRDAWVDALLGLPELPEDSPHLPRGSVPYLPAGVDEILAMVREAPVRAEDVFVDVGSGLGRVAMLAHLLSGARAHGVEIQPQLVETSLRCRDALRLSDVTFEVADATEVALDGSVVFLYAPFNGRQLDAVFDHLRALAKRRRIVICAVGVELPDEPWLTRRATSSPALTVFESRWLVKMGPA